MARRDIIRGSVRVKGAMATRLAELRAELYGDRGGPEMARRLGIPVRRWYNYEGGVTVPADVVLKVIEMTSVEAVWLLHGEGPKFRDTRSENAAPRPTVVAEVLSKASTIRSPQELEELTAGVLALRAKALAPVASDEETRLLLAINEGVSVDLTDRVASLIEKRDESGLSLAEQNELLELADSVERRGLERAQALSTLAEVRGVSLRELMKSLGVAAGGHG